MVECNSVKTTDYFLTSVMERRPYLRTEWLEQALREPLRTEVQENGRIRYWVYITEADKYLRVVTECSEPQNLDR